MTGHGTWRQAATLARSVVALAKRTRITFLAAAVAYYGFVSLLPLFVVVLSVASTVGGKAFATRVSATLEDFLAPTAQTAVREGLTTGTGRGIATITSLLVLLWSGLKVFRGLDHAFSEVYGTEETKGFLGSVRDAGIALGAIATGVGVAVGVGAAIAGLAGPVGTALGALVGFLTLVAAFYPLYYVFADADLAPTEPLPGSIGAALGWIVLANSFGIYASNAGGIALYGVLGGAFLLVTWLYFAALVLILGAVVNAVVAGRVTPESIHEPDL